MLKGGYKMKPQLSSLVWYSTQHHVQQGLSHCGPCVKVKSLEPSGSLLPELILDSIA